MKNKMRLTALLTLYFSVLLCLGQQYENVDSVLKDCRCKTIDSRMIDTERQLFHMRCKLKAGKYDVLIVRRGAGASAEETFVRKETVFLQPLSIASYRKRPLKKFFLVKFRRSGETWQYDFTNKAWSRLSEPYKPGESSGSERPHE